MKLFIKIFVPAAVYSALSFASAKKIRKLGGDNSDSGDDLSTGLPDGLGSFGVGFGQSAGSFQVSNRFGLYPDGIDIIDPATGSVLCTDCLPVDLWYPTHFESSSSSGDANDLSASYSVNIPGLLSSPIEIPFSDTLQSPAPASGPHPLVVFSTARVGSSFFHVDIFKKLASHGFVVAVVTHPGDTTADLLAGLLDDPDFANPTSITLCNRVKDIRDVIAYLTSSQQNIVDINVDWIATFGHSLGGSTALSSAFGFGDNTAIFPKRCDYAGDDGVKAVVSMAPATDKIFSPEEAGSSTIPVLILSSGKDGLLPPVDHVDPIFDPIKCANKDSILVELLDGTHNSFADLCDGSDYAFGIDAAIAELPPNDAQVLESIKALGTIYTDDACSPEFTPIDTAHEIIGIYAVSFLKYVLLGEDSYKKFLEGLSQDVFNEELRNAVDETFSVFLDTDAHCVETNTNQCIVKVGEIATGLNNDQALSGCFSGETECCKPLVKAYSSGCFCNPSMEVLFGPQLIGLLEQSALPACLAVNTVDVVDCSEVESYDYRCDIENMALDAARLETSAALGVVYDRARTDQCFDFEAIKAAFGQVFDENPSTIVPYGIGTYTGVENMIEYLGIFWGTLTRNFLTSGPIIGLGGQFSFDGRFFVSITALTGAFALGQIPFGDTQQGQKLRNITSINKFERCSTKIKSLEVLPSANFAWLTSAFGHSAENFDMWGVDAICEYHERVCRPANHATYNDKAECVDQIGNLPKFSDACGPNRPLAGNSLSCKFKHVLMTPLSPENHCYHIGPEGTTDSEGVQKCVDAIECPSSFPPLAYQALLDQSALALEEPIGSNYIYDFSDEGNADFTAYANAQSFTNQLYETEGWQYPDLCVE